MSHRLTDIIRAADAIEPRDHAKALIALAEWCCEIEKRCEKCPHYKSPSGLAGTAEHKMPGQPLNIGERNGG